VRRAAGTAPSRTPPIRGKSLNPEPIAVVPSTPWKYCGIVNKTPINARNDMAAKIAPQVNEAELNSVMSSNGWPPGRRVNRRSQARKPNRIATLRKIMSRAQGLLQPSSPALISP
jgi:hypothetical protein